MREYGHILQKSFVNGLRPDSRVANGAPFLEYCANLKPSEFGLISPETVADPLNQTVVHPYPALLRGENVTLLASGSAVRLVDESDWTSTAISITGLIATGGPWQMASFQDLYFITNGNSLIWKIPSNASGATILNTTQPVKSVLNHGDRLIMGGLRATSWMATTPWTKVFAAWRETQPEHLFSHEGLAWNTNWIIWSEFGGGADDVPFLTLMCALGYEGATRFDKFEEVILKHIEQRKIGMCPLRQPGGVLRLESLGNGIAAFGANSISYLEPNNEGSYDERERVRVGIAGRGAVGGYRGSLVFLDANRHLWRWEAGSEPQRLGYREFFPATGGEIIISYDPVEQDYWITNGVYCYVLSRTGLGGPMDVCPTCLLRDDAYGLVGISAHPSTFVAEFRTVPTDLNRRDSKNVKLFQLTGDGYTSGLARVEWRKSIADSYAESPWAKFNDVGVAFPGVSFVDGKFTVRCATTGAAKFSRMDMRYQAEGRIYVRGTIADTADA